VGKRLSLFALFFLFMANMADVEGLSYILKDLGTLQTEKSTVEKINDGGYVTGQILMKNQKNDPPQNKLQDKYVHFVWEQDKGLTQFGFTSPSCHAPLINNHNHIAGTFWYFTKYWIFPNFAEKHVYLIDESYAFNDLQFPLNWEIDRLESWKIPYQWDNHELAVIGYNDLNQILIADSCHEKKRTQFAIWKDGVFHPIDAAVLEKAYAINNEGIVLGRKWIVNEGNHVPTLVLYDPSTEGIAPITKDLEITIHDFNDANQIVGVRKFASSPNKSDGFFWEWSSGIVLMDSFLPSAINNKGQIVGYKVLSDDTLAPALWDNGQVTDLNQMLNLENSESAWVKIVTVKDINNDGWIIGEGIYDDKTHGFVLIPLE
jgi:hypothetical protein